VKYESKVFTFSNMKMKLWYRMLAKQCRETTLNISNKLQILEERYSSEHAINQIQNDSGHCTIQAIYSQSLKGAFQGDSL